MDFLGQKRAGSWSQPSLALLHYRIVWRGGLRGGLKNSYAIYRGVTFCKKRIFDYKNGFFATVSGPPKMTKNGHFWVISGTRSERGFWTPWDPQKWPFWGSWRGLGGVRRGPGAPLRGSGRGPSGPLGHIG